jgi:tripeptidyl-peptidase-1
MKLALRGVTVVAASGDSGVTAGGKCMGPGFDITLPTFLSCPYITLIGTTEITPGSPPGISERAVSKGVVSGWGLQQRFRTARLSCYCY